MNGIIHLDIKPENICFDANFKLKIIDFGNAKSFHEVGFGFEHYEEISERAELRKKELDRQVYSAPEIAVLRATGSCSSDVWSCGVILYVLLMGKPPWRRPIAEGLLRDKLFCEKLSGFYPSKLGERVTELLMKIWRPEPEDRLTIEEIKKSNFFNGPVPTKESVDQEMLERTRMAWLGEEQPEMLRILSSQREARPEPGYQLLEVPALTQSRAP